MAIQTRYAGDANGVNNVDAKYDGTLGTIVATGLTKNPTAIAVTLGGAGPQVFLAGDSATGGPVEAILKQIAIDSTIVMYQVDTKGLSVLVEATGGTTSAIATRIATLANASATLGTGNVWANLATVTSTSGFKLSPNA
jgi:hypothetical protein